MTLVHSMLDEPPILFAGAGTSVAAGYPTWAGLLDKLDAELQKRRKKRALFPGWQSERDRVREDYLGYLKSVPDLLWRAEEYRREMGKSFDSILKDIFKPRKKGSPAIARVIADLNFKHVLTTNYDGSLEKALRPQKPGGRTFAVIEWTRRSSVRQFFRDLHSNRPVQYFVYLHGRYRSPRNMVFTDGQYVNRYILSDDANKKLIALFMTQPILFVGFSLDDPQFNSLFRVVNAHLGADATPRHFILMASEGHAEKEAAMEGLFRDKYGIQPIFFQYSKDHADLVETLVALKDAIKYVKREREAAVTAKPNLLSFWDEQKPLALRRALLTRKRTAKKQVDPEDPHKGQFGGLSERDGFRLTAKVRPTRNPDWFEIFLKVTGTARAKLTGPVVFYLHPTFSQGKIEATSRGGTAKLELEAYGAFTVGALIRSTRTKLELDLADLPDAPPLFRDR